MGLRAAAVLAATALVLAGCRGADTSSTTTAPAPEPGSWERVSGMAFPRSEMPGAVLDGMVYVPGGFMTTAQGGATGTARVEVYDPDADSWSAAPDLPEARHHLMAAAHGGMVWVVGGYGDDGPADTIWSLGPDHEEWAEHAPMPVPVAAGAAASLAGHIYIVGGVPAGDVTLRYDPATDAWEELEPMPSPRQHLAAASHDGKVWAIAGRWGGEERAIVEVFDPANGSWGPGPALNRARGGFGATVWNGKIVVAGGEVLGGLETLDSVEVLEGGSWVDLEPMPVALHGNAVAAVQGRLLVLGGSRRAGAIANSGDTLLFESDGR